jgi:hypothetical protein
MLYIYIPPPLFPAEHESKIQLLILPPLGGELMYNPPILYPLPDWHSLNKDPNIVP